MPRMAEGPQDLIGVGKAAERLIESGEKFAKTLLGPLFTELGELFADPIREYRRRRSARVLVDTKARIEAQRHDVRAVPGRVLIPLLEHASLDEELHDRWVAMLANAADADGAVCVTPAFPRLLAELSATEINALDWVLEHGRHVTEDGTEQFSITGNEAQDALGIATKDFEMMASNVYRLGIAEPIWGSVQRHFTDGTTTSTRVYFKFLLTPLGVAFVRACRY
jgi:hypothetical protein